MKIGILTLHSSFNYGAYLQAYALQKVVRSFGHEVEFINRMTPKAIKQRNSRLLSKNPKKLFFNFKLYRSFARTWATLPIGDKILGEAHSDYDAIIIGSDEVWNVANSGSFELPTEFFGNSLGSRHVISYAPSVGFATYEDLANVSYVAEGLSNLKFLSGRDVRTIDAVSRLTGRQVERVLDPTFLTTYEEIEQDIKFQKYILVYTYGLSGERIAMIRDFAKRRGLRLISACFYNAWCDHLVPGTAGEFLGLVRNADLIITDTFHGLCFSLIYRKEFAVFGGKPKVSALVEQFGIDGRDVTVRGSLDEVFNEAPRYTDFEASLERYKRDSLGYLSKSLPVAQNFQERAVQDQEWHPIGAH